MRSMVPPPVPSQSAQPAIGIHKVASVQVPLGTFGSIGAAAGVVGLAEQLASTGLRGRRTRLV